MQHEYGTTADDGEMNYWLYVIPDPNDLFFSRSLLLHYMLCPRSHSPCLRTGPSGTVPQTRQLPPPSVGGVLFSCL